MKEHDTPSKPGYYWYQFNGIVAAEVVYINREHLAYGLWSTSYGPVDRLINGKWGPEVFLPEGWK